MLRGLLVLAMVMVGFGVLACIAVIVAMARIVLRPRRMTDARALMLLHRLTPGDLGMEFEEVSFSIIDECDGGKIEISGWWIPNPEARGRCAVIVHGYSDAKVGGIAWAPLLRSLGFAILAVDLRAHGESGGKYSTGAYWERHDLNQVLDQLRSRRPEQTQQVLLFGISLGAAVVSATAVMRSDIWAVILEGPYFSFEHAAAYQAERMGVPGPFFQNKSFRIAQWMAKCDYRAVRPVDTIPKIPCPLMAIQACDDPFLSDQDRTAVREAVESRTAPGLMPSICWELEGVHHVVGMREDLAEYRRRIEDFLSQVLQRTVGICDK